jgi:hypothetical protein
MKAYLEFDLSTQGGQDEHACALYAGKVKCAITKFIEQSLRKRIKYGELSEEITDLLTTIRSELIEQFDGYGVKDWLE